MLWGIISSPNIWIIIMRLVPLLFLVFVSFSLRAENLEMTLGKPLAKILQYQKHNHRCYLEYRKATIGNKSLYGQTEDENGIVFHYCIDLEFKEISYHIYSQDIAQIDNPQFVAIDMDKDGKSEYILQGDYNGHIVLNIYSEESQKLYGWTSDDTIIGINSFDKTSHIELQIIRHITGEFYYEGRNYDEYYLIETYKKLEDQLIKIDIIKQPLAPKRQNKQLTSPITQAIKDEFAGYPDNNYNPVWKRDVVINYTASCFLEYRRAILYHKDEGQINDFNGALFHYCVDQTQPTRIVSFKSIKIIRSISPKFEALDLDKDGLDEIIFYADGGRTTTIHVFKQDTNSIDGTPKITPLKGEFPYTQNNNIKFIHKDDFVEIRTMNSRLWMFDDKSKPFKLIQTYRKFNDRIIQTASKKIPLKINNFENNRN